MTEVKGSLRINEFMQSRFDVGINDLVEIKVVESKTAKDITFAPTEPLRIVGVEEYLAEYLNGTLMTKGDTVPIKGRVEELIWL